MEEEEATIKVAILGMKTLPPGGDIGVQREEVWDRGSGRTNLVTARVHLGEAPLSYLPVYHEVPDGIFAGGPCPPGRRLSFSHGFLMSVDDDRKLAGRRGTARGPTICGRRRRRAGSSCIRSTGRVTIDGNTEIARQEEGP